MVFSPHFPPCFRTKQPLDTGQRTVTSNDPALNKSHGFCSNHINTSKYNILTFLPINLFEQLQRAANLYFILQIVIMSIPAITALNPMSTAVPLLLIMIVTMVKDGYDDLGRHRSDRRLNNQTTSVLDAKGEVRKRKWQDVKTGDFIRVENNEPVCADILVLTTGEETGLCFVETAELDGETNLKVRQPHTLTFDHFMTEECDELHSQLAAFDGTVTCETPNNRLDRFEGNLEWDGETVSLDNSNIILRGCVLRNTVFVYGLVLYSGHDSKLMMNSGKRVFKRTKLDRLTNLLVIWIAGLLGLICAFLSLMSYFWERDFGSKWLFILPWEDFYNKDPGLIALINWPGFIMVLNTLIPISLYISVEIIRLGQSLLINWDSNIYHEDSDTPALARNTTLTEELGQIQYIFSDKTGTLTQNEMCFKQCSINGKVYGHTVDEEGSLDNLPCVDFSFNRYADPGFEFRDQALVDSIRNNESDSVEFFRLLAVCHTVMVEDCERSNVQSSIEVGDVPSKSGELPSKSGELPSKSILDYQAQSPDEGALVSAARDFGIVFKNRTPTTITIECNNIEEVYELLCVLDFDNVRKRMSVIVRKDESIMLYCKGADTIMYDLLSDAKSDIKEATLRDLDLFARSGLRTLLLASKELSQASFDEWFASYEEASTAMEGREEKVMATFCEIEKDLNILGATAIEDKLQDGVPETIARLAEANINIWVLTGDKQETAINIGYSSLLLTEDMIDVFIVDGDSESVVLEQIDRYSEKIETFTMSKESGTIPTVRISNHVQENILMTNEQHDSESADFTGKEGFGLVIPGRSLAFALHPDHELKFLALAKLCKAVIACRVTPLQKALVVELVKRNVKATTLAIGDGANDVSMIKAAHIGVGISGKEGRQAVLAADYSFAQFRFLERLLLVHGRWSYWRMSKFLSYFFYKNFAFTLVQFWFNIFCGFSAQSLYDEWYISVYNVVFTSMPVLAMGIFDQDVSARKSLDFPKLYIPGQLNILFNKRTFIVKLFHGIATSLVMFFIPYGIYMDVVDTGGVSHSDLGFFGVAVGTILVVTVNLQMALDTDHWTWLNHLFIWGSIIFYFIYTLVIYSQTLFDFMPGLFSDVGDALGCFGYSNFWATLILTSSVCIPPCMGYRWMLQKIRPTLPESIRRKDAKALRKRITGRELLSKRRRRVPTRERPASTRSAFAFSQEKGFGALLFKGRLKNPLKAKSAKSYDLGKAKSRPCELEVNSNSTSVSSGKGLKPPMDIETQDTSL